MQHKFRCVSLVGNNNINFDIRILIIIFVDESYAQNMITIMNSTIYINEEGMTTL